MVSIPKVENLRAEDAYLYGKLLLRYGMGLRGVARRVVGKRGFVAGGTLGLLPLLLLGVGPVYSQGAAGQNESHPAVVIHTDHGPSSARA